MKVDVAVIGGGPAGLAAAEAALGEGASVAIFDAKPSLARKLLMAGKSGLNLTKNEPPDELAAHVSPPLRPYVAAFGAKEIMGWAEGLGEPLFTGSSGRVFPKTMKASPLLRKWLQRISAAEVRTGWRWKGWSEGSLRFETPDRLAMVDAGAVVLALGGASWKRLGADGAWAEIFAEAGIALTPFRPANMGFDVDWSAHFRNRFDGAPVKSVALSAGSAPIRGEFIITKTGIEGGGVYALSAALRDAGLEAVLTLDLIPDRSVEDITERLSRPRGKASLSTFLRKALRLDAVKIGLVRENDPDALTDMTRLAARLKSLRIPLQGSRPIDEAISVAGGVAWEALDEDLMLTAKPGTFCAGEMLDWEAPTGGYLVTGCLATGFHAGRAAARFTHAN